MANIGIQNSLLLTTVNTPTRTGERIASISEISNVITPFIGMIIYVEDEGKFIYVKSLKNKPGLITLKNGQVDKWEYLNTGNSEGLDLLQLRVTTNEENITANTINIILLNSSIDTLTSNLTSVNQQLSIVLNDLGTTKLDVILLKSDANTEGSVRYLIKEQLGSELTIIKNNISNNSQSIKTNTLNIQLLQSDVLNINSELTKINTTLGIITNDEEGIDTLREVLEFVNDSDLGEVLALEKRVTTLETNYNQIDGKIDEKIAQAFNWENIDQK